MKIVTFGELMLRLEPQGYLRFLQEPQFQATFGGGEANVAVSLANFGATAEFVSKLPTHDIGEAAVRELRSHGVGVANLARGGDRVGLYYLEKGASMRPGRVIYDRAGSAFATSSQEDYDWDKIFDGADWFHFTGITPALSDNLVQITETALKAAKKYGLTVSCDLNYRKKLWSKDKAKEVMSRLAGYVDLCIANEEDAYDVFGITAEGSDAEGGKLDRAGYQSVAETLSKKFGFSRVAITLRESISANDNNWSAMLYSANGAIFARKYAIRIVDRVGGGDSFAAALIYGLNTYETEAEALEFAVAASALKHTIEGDFNRITVAEAEALAHGSGTGRVVR